MNRRFRKIVLFGVLSFAVPAAVHAQRFNARDIMRAQQEGRGNNLYGSNPYEQNEDDENGGQNLQDSTQKKNVSANRSNPTFQRFHPGVEQLQVEPAPRIQSGGYPAARYDPDRLAHRLPVLPRGDGRHRAGGIGTASLPFNYFRRPQDFDFSFASPYYAYVYTMENVPFYNSKRPLIRLTYIESGQKRFREENFNIMHAQNISPSTGFNVDYKARGTRGQYLWSRTKNHNLSVAFSHTGRRYAVHAGYFNNHIEKQENGGIVGAWAIADTTFEMPSGVPTKLADAEAQNTYRNNAFFVTQSYGIPLQRMTDEDFSMAGLSAVYVGHSFEYNSWSKVYSDIRAPYIDERDHRNPDGSFAPAEYEYYKDWYIDPLRTRDSLYERVISNRFFVQAQPWDRNGVIGTIDAGVGIGPAYLFAVPPIGISVGTLRQGIRNQLLRLRSRRRKNQKYLDWDANLKFYPSGYRGGDLSIGGHLALMGALRGHPLILEGRFSMERRSPNYWQENLLSNHYVWSAPLGKENETRFEVKLEVPDYAFEAGAWFGFVDNKIYYDAQSHIAQSDANVSLTSVYARKDFRLGGLHLDHRALLQWSTNQEVVPVPLLSAFLSYYYEFWVVRNVLRLQIGLDGRYNTKYHAPGFNPALSAFYNQREIEVGNYPYVDLFVMASGNGCGYS